MPSTSTMTIWLTVEAIDYCATGKRQIGQTRLEVHLRHALLRAQRFQTPDDRRNLQPIDLTPAAVYALLDDTEIDCSSCHQHTLRNACRSAQRGFVATPAGSVPRIEYMPEAA